MTTPSTKLKSSLWAAAGLVLLSNALLLLQRHPAQAQSPGVNLAVLANTVGRPADPRRLFGEPSYRRAERHQRRWQAHSAPSGSLGPKGALGIAGTVGPKGMMGAAGPFGPKGLLGAGWGGRPRRPARPCRPARCARAYKVPAVTLPFTVSGTPRGKRNALVTLSGYNLHVVSGSGSTSDGTADAYGNPTGQGTLTGLGNVIIGYNDLQGQGSNGPRDFRTGSHNLVLGDQNNYTSFGGLVAGSYNTISAPYATVTGGSFNTASGLLFVGQRRQRITRPAACILPSAAAAKTSPRA